MNAETITVITYAGRKGDERPATFFLRGIRIDVVEIQDSWIEEGYEDRVRRRYFRIRGDDGNMHCIFYNEDIEEWFYSSARKNA